MAHHWNSDNKLVIFMKKLFYFDKEISFASWPCDLQQCMTYLLNYSLPLYNIIYNNIIYNYICNTFIYTHIIPLFVYTYVYNTLINTYISPCFVYTHFYIHVLCVHIYVYFICIHMYINTVLNYVGPLMCGFFGGDKHSVYFFFIMISLITFSFVWLTLL